MEVKIGVQHTSREIVLESSESPDDVEAAVSKALGTDDGLLTLADEKGRRVIIPAARLAYVEISAQVGRRVGFGVTSAS